MDASRRHDPAALAQALKREAHALGFAAAGITDARPTEHGSFYRSWVEHGYHGEMAYLARPDALRRREDLRETWPEVRSVLVVADAYVPEDAPGVPDDPSVGVVARYARGADYHRVLARKLERLRVWLAEELGLDERPGRVYVDTGPVLERDLARRAGIGWYGRNTMLIDPRRGSYFLLGALLLDLDLPTDEPFEADRCGTCHACLDACPTGALLGRDEDGAPVIDATRCISYLTIELDGSIPMELRPAIGNRVFGCDICQEVCPWNGGFAVAAADPAYGARGVGERPHGVEPLPDVPAGTFPGTDSPSLVDLMRMTREEWDAFSRGSSIRRAGYEGFRRNVAVALGNWLTRLEGTPPAEAVAVLRDALEDESGLVREHAAWALGQRGEE